MTANASQARHEQPAVHESPVDGETADIAADGSWRQIEQLIDEIALLARSDSSTEEFHAALLDRSIAALAANGGAVWTAGGDELLLEYQVNLAGTPLDDRSAPHAGHRQLLQSVLSGGAPRVVPPHSGSAADREPANPLDSLLVLCPLREEGTAVGVVEILARPNLAPAVQQGAVRLLASFCELASEFYSLRQLRTLRARDSLRDRFETFAAAVHHSLDFDRTSYTIANDGRELLGCDRLSVLVRRRGTFRLAATSGAHRLERRSNAVRRLEQLTSAVLATGRPLFHTSGEPDELPPEIQRPLSACLDETHARLLAIHPLRETTDDETNGEETGCGADRRGPHIIGAVVVEQFDAAAGNDLPARIDMLSRLSGPALRNAAEFRKWPIPRAVRNAGWFVQAEQLPRTVLAAGLLLALLLSLWLIPADFTIEARGQLQPQQRRDVFAPRDGSVEQLLIAQETLVEENQPLVVLRDPQLDLEFKRVWGDIQTAGKQLAAVRAERGAAEFGDARSRAAAKQLSAEEAEIEERLNSLRAQYAILEEQQAGLTVRSPLAGRVLTWDVEQLLESRPVRTGQILMTVADPGGPWELELHVPDHDAGHVLDARQARGEPLKVSFILATNPDVTYEETIDRIALSTELDGERQPSVLVTAGLENSQIDRKRPGATVIAHIHCGRRSLGYVWLRQLIEAVQTHILF